MDFGKKANGGRGEVEGGKGEEKKTIVIESILDLIPRTTMRALVQLITRFTVIPLLLL